MPPTPAKHNLDSKHLCNKHLVPSLLPSLLPSFLLSLLPFSFLPNLFVRQKGREEGGGRQGRRSTEGRKQGRRQEGGGEGEYLFIAKAEGKEGRKAERKEKKRNEGGGAVLLSLPPFHVCFLPRFLPYVSL